MRSTRVVSAVAVFGFILSCVNGTGIEGSFRADMTGAKEVPLVASSGTGAFAADLNDQNLLLYDISFAALTSPATQAHLHGPANGTQAAPILVDLDAPGVGRSITLGSTAGAGQGTLDLKVNATVTVTGDSLRRLLNLGMVYADIHTINNPNGEIRGQVFRR
jgi:CHRD domain